MSLTVNNIKFGYQKDKLVLDDVSFSLQKGESLGILGASGSGKSTLLKIISGLIKHERDNYFEGTVQFDGKSPEEIRHNAKLSFMFQESTLLPDRNVFENVALPLRILNQFKSEKVLEMLELVELKDSMHKLPKELSGGMKTRTALARSFITSPTYLFLDEPFSSLDLPKKTDLYKTLFDLGQKFQTSILIVSHDIEEIVYLTNKIYILSKHGHKLDEVIINEQLPRTFEYTDVVKNLATKITYINNLIYLDSVRQEASQADFIKYMNIIGESIGTENEKSALVFNSIDRIRNFTNNEEANQKLLSFWHLAKKELKFKLAWDILNYSGLSKDDHMIIFNFILTHMREFSESSFPFYSSERSELLHALLQRINSSIIPPSKKWIYLCNVPSMSNISDARKLLQEVIDMKNEEFVYPFAKHVAESVLNEIKDVKI